MRIVVLGILTSLLVMVSFLIGLARVKLTGHPPGSPQATGFLLGSAVALPAVVLGVASIWRANRTPFRLLLTANIALVLNVIVSLSSFAKARKDQPATQAGAIRACVSGCLERAGEKQSTMSADLLRRLCKETCDCAMEVVPPKGTPPKPGAARPQTQEQMVEMMTRCANQAVEKLGITPEQLGGGR